MSADELQQYLRGHDPVGDDAFVDLAASPAAADLLQAIVSSEPSGHADSETKRATGRSWQPSSRRLLSAAAVVLVTMMALAFVRFDRPSAAAAIESAASATAEATSGRLVVTVELTTLPESDPTPSGSTMRFDARYDGGDYHLLSDVSDLGPPEAADSLITSHIRVDDRHYLRVGAAGWSETTGRWSPADDAGVGVAVDQLTSSSEQLAELLREVDDLRQLDGPEGAIRYTGSLRSEVVRNAEPDELPIGVSVLQAHPIPDVLGVEVTVRDGHLESVVVRVEGLVDGYGYQDVTVRSIYDQIGEPQAIEPPESLVPIVDAAEINPDDPDGSYEPGAGLIRVSGEVDDQPTVEPDGTIAFRLRRSGSPIPVLHQGPLPNRPIEAASQVLVLGRLQDGQFIAEQVVVRVAS